MIFFRLELVVDPWIEGLFPALQKHLGVADTISSFVPNPEIFGNPDSNSPNELKEENKWNVKESEKSADLEEIMINSEEMKEMSTTDELTRKTAQSLSELKLDTTSDDEFRAKQRNSIEERLQFVKENISSLREKLPQLQEEALTLPVCPPRYLSISFENREKVLNGNICLYYTSQN